MRTVTETSYWLFILLASQNWFELQEAVFAAGLVGMYSHRGTLNTILKSKVRQKHKNYLLFNI